MRDLSQSEIENVSGAGVSSEVISCFSREDIVLAGIIMGLIAIGLWLCHEH
jgi:hypothetical protein